MPIELDDLRAKRGVNDSVRFANSAYVKQLQAKGPQAVVKAVSSPRGHRVRVLMDYVTRADDKEKDTLTAEDQDGLTHHGDEANRAMWEEWRQDFERTPEGSKRPPRHSYHLILSADCENKPENARKVYAAARAVLEEQLGAAGYRYMTVLHTDTANPHVHVVLNAYNRDKNLGKLRLNPPELLAMRIGFAERMTELGLEHAATKRRDRAEVLEKIAAGIERLQEGGTWYQRTIQKAAEQTTQAGERPFDAFAKRRQMAKTIARLRVQVKEATLPHTEERKALMGSLRTIERNLIKPVAPDLDRLVDTLKTKADKDLARFDNYLHDLKNPTGAETKLSAQALLKRRRALEKIVEGNLKSVQDAQKDLLIKSQGAGAIKRLDLAASLKSYEQRLGRLRDRSR